MAQKPSTLEDWEVSLIKAMLVTETFPNKQDILPYFSRPGRTVNQARISQIASGKVRPNVQAASAAQLRAFLANWSDKQAAKKSFNEEEPLHPTVLAQTFRVRKTSPPRLDLGEADWVEVKQSFNWNSRADYARTMAGFANNRGGYLLFGIHDTDKQLLGLNGKAFEDRDPASITQYLNQCFSPAIRWEKGVATIGGVIVGAIYVWPCLSKPSVCTKNDGSELREADIYFRYPGMTGRIKSGELQHLLQERERLRDEQWRQTVSRIGEMGVSNAAIMNTASGEVTGPGGKFLIDEKLLSKVKFIRDGEFSVKSGSPTLRLIGDIQPVTALQVWHKPITDSELMLAFLEQQIVPDPMSYIRSLAHLQPLWLPVYYFVLLAKVGVVEAASALEAEKTPYNTYKNRQISRIKGSKAPPKSSVAKHQTAHEKIIAGAEFDFNKVSEAREFLFAIRTLDTKEIDIGSLLPMLRVCFDKYYHDASAKLMAEIRYASAYVDAIVWIDKLKGA